MIIHLPFRKFVQTYEMHRLLLIILSSFFLLISCDKSAPDGILPEKKMVDLMADVHLLDGYFNTLPIDSSRKLIDGMYHRVFDNYGIDSVGFQQNLNFYLGNPTLSKKIYTQVKDKLTQIDGEYRLSDSIKNNHLNDSTRLAQRYTRLKEEARRLILDVHIDTIPLNYGAYRTMFMQGAGLSLNIYQQESTPVSGPVPLPTSGVQQPADASDGPIEKKVLPIANPSVERERLKPVKELQSLP